jgi:myo-inositol-1(or 4)-monophosphatase
MPLKQPDLKFLELLIRQAGSVTLNFFQKNFTIQEKPNNQGIVTEADFNSEKLIKNHIHEHFPHHDILAEESGLSQYVDNPQKDRQPLWIIDPLDGTTNFSKGNPYYCISIAYGVLDAQRFDALLGAVYQPTTQSLFIAEKDKGAYLNGKQIMVSQLKNFHSASIVTGFSSNKGSELQSVTETIAAIQDKSLGLRINGAAALDLAHTACGIFQGFYEMPLAPWDTAAGALLIKEAKGKVTNFAGNSFCPLSDKGIIATNSFLYDELFDILNKFYKNKN